MYNLITSPLTQGTHHRHGAQPAGGLRGAAVGARPAAALRRVTAEVRVLRQMNQGYRSERVVNTNAINIIELSGSETP